MTDEPSARTVSLETCVIDRETGLVVGDAGEDRLSTTELALLNHLVSHVGRTVAREELLREVWQYGPSVVSRAPDDTMRRLRKKVERSTRAVRHLVTVHGEGYRFVPLGDPTPPSPGTATSGARVLRFGDVAVDLGRRTVTWEDGREHPLRTAEVSLLEGLLEAPGMQASRIALERRIWGPGEEVRERSVDTVVRTLRARLEADPHLPRRLVAVRGLGYRLVLPAPREAASGLPGSGRGGMVGRHEEMRELEALLEGPGVVVLTGPGGIGKTRLATHVVNRLRRARPDSWVGLCDLSSCDGRHALIQAIAGGLEAGVSGAGSDPVADLGLALRAKGRAVLLLDNFERLALTGAPVIERLATLAPRARLLLTTQVMPVLPRARCVVLGPLRPTEAVALYRLRATRTDPTEQDEIAELVERLDRLPLAIELAAGRSGLLAPGEMLERLSERLEYLGGNPSGPPRHASLRHAIEWSFELLPAGDRVGLCCAALFAGPFRGVDFCEAAGLGLKEGLDTLQRLVVASLVVPAGEGRSERRFRLLESVRVFALGGSASLAVEAEACGRYIALMRRRGAELDDTDRQRGSAESRRALGEAAPDLLSALRLATDPVARADLTRQVAPIIHMRGQPERTVQMLEQALEALPTSEVRIGTVLRVNLAWSLIARFTQLDRVPGLLGPALQAAQELADDELMFRTMQAQGYFAHQNGDLEGFAEWNQRSLPHAMRLRRTCTVAQVEGNLALNHRLAGRPAEALHWARRALERLGDEGHCRLRGHQNYHLGHWELERGHLAAAEFRTRRAEEASCAGGDKTTMLEARAQLARVAWHAGRRSAARASLAETAIALRALGRPVPTALADCERGRLLLLEGEAEAAEELLRGGLESLGDSVPCTLVLSYLGACLAGRGQGTEARALLERAERAAPDGSAHQAVVALIADALDPGQARQLDEDLETWHRLELASARQVVDWLRPRL